MPRSACRDNMAGSVSISPDNLILVHAAWCTKLLRGEERSRFPLGGGILAWLVTSRYFFSSPLLCALCSPLPLPFLPPPPRDARSPSNGTEPNGKAIGVSPRGCHLKYQADCLRPRTRYPAKVSRAARNLYEAPEARSYTRVWRLLFVIDATLSFLDLKKNCHCWGFHDFPCSNKVKVCIFMLFLCFTLRCFMISWFLNSYITWI